MGKILKEQTRSSCFLNMGEKILNAFQVSTALVRLLAQDCVAKDEQVSLRNIWKQQALLLKLISLGS